MQALQLGNQMFIYKERGAIIAQTLSGRAAPTWQYQTLYAGSSGILAANTLRNIGGRRQMFLGVGDIMMFDGRDIAGTSEKVFNQISDLVDVVDIHKSWAFWDEQRQDYQLWFPAGGTSNPARCWTYNVPKKAWYGPTEPNTTQGKYVLGEYSQELDILIWSDQSSSWDSSAITWDAEQVSEQTPYLFTTSGMVYRVTGTSNLFDAGAIDTRLDFSELFFYEKQDPNAYRPPTGSRVLARWEEVEIEAAVGSGATLTLQYSTDEGNNFTSIGSPVSTTYDSTLRRYVWYPDFVADKVRWRLDKTGAGTSIRIAGARFAGQPIERR